MLGEPMPNSTISSASIAFLGFGEAARAFLDGWRADPDFKGRICAYDIKTNSLDPQVRTAKRADYAAAKVLGASSAAEAVTGAEAVFSVVTADQAHEAAMAALPGLARGALFFDCNSCAPQTKSRTAQEVEAAGGRYVDVAVMAAVHPRLHRTPLLISGPHVEAAAAACSRRKSTSVGEGPRRPSRRRLVGQDDPLHHDEGTRGAGLRMRPGRAEGGGHRDCAQFARRHLPRLRLEEALRPLCSSG